MVIPHSNARRWLILSLSLYAITTGGLYTFTVLVGGTHYWNGKLSLSIVVILTSYLASIACILPPGLGYFQSSHRSRIEAVYVAIMILLAIVCGVLVSLVLLAAIQMSVGFPTYSLKGL
jgi:hypothetical protein